MHFPVHIFLEEGLTLGCRMLDLIMKMLFKCHWPFIVNIYVIIHQFLSLFLPLALPSF